MTSPDMPRLKEAYRRMWRQDISKCGEWLASIIERADQNGAMDLLGAIQEVWKDESFYLPADQDRERPDPGLLRATGYRVGSTAQKPHVRQLILVFLLHAVALPPIKNQLYIEEWGGSQSQKRFRKLDRVLANLIADCRHTFPLATAHWEEDQSFLQTYWSDFQKQRAAKER